MKKIIGNILLLIAVLAIVSCNDSTFVLDYKAPVSIGFTGVDNTNEITVAKGVMSYSAKIEVNATSSGILNFELYTADIRTGAKISLITGTSKSFDDGEGKGVPTYSFEYMIDNLVASKAIKVLVTDESGNKYERNLVVKITPVVLFSETVIMETVENYYGPYYATWLNGRVYMRRDGEKYKDEIDFSCGNVIIASEGATAVPALVSPGERSTYNLLTLTGLQQTKFELTTLTKAQYDAISQVDATPVTSLADPTLNAVKLVSGKVYLFKTANGKKGLIYISALATKTGTIETSADVWEKNITYHQLTITTKLAL